MLTHHEVSLLVSFSIPSSEAKCAYAIHSAMVKPLKHDLHYMTITSITSEKIIHKIQELACNEGFAVTSHVPPHFQS